METQEQLEAALRAQKEAEAIARLEAHLREKQQVERSMKRRLRANSFFGFVAGVVVTSLVALTVDIPMLLRNSNSITGLGIVRASATPTVLLATSTPWPTPMPMSTEEPVRAVRVQLGNFSVCVVTEKGGVKCKQTQYDKSWQSVKGLERGVQSIALGGGTGCAVLSTGGVKCWNEPDSSTYSVSYAASEVVGSEADVSEVALSDDSVCLLTNSGSVKCWHRYLNSTEYMKPSSLSDVLGASRNVQMIAAGNQHMCALLNSGGVKCWGKNDFGQLGTGWTRRESAATEVIGLRSGVKMIAAGGDYTCAVMESGGVKCWGEGTSGQLGNGGVMNASVPQEVIGLDGKVTSIALGFYHTCALMDDGVLKCWGSHYTGMLGALTPDAPETIRTPQKIHEFDGVTAVDASAKFTCVLLETGAVQCVGTYADG